MFKIARFTKFTFCSANTPFQQKRAIFTSSLRSEDYDPIYEPILDMMAKTFRKMFIDRQLIDFKKVIVPAKRVRSLSDNIAQLQKQREVAAVIEGRDEFQDVDLVFDFSQLSSVKRRICADAAPIYVKLENDEEVRCTLGEIIRDQRSDWPFKVHLRRYIVGRPNLLWIPVSVEENYHNPSSNRGTDLNTHIYGVWVYSYNNTYPTRFVVDPRNVQRSRPYKLGDLQNTFPQGIVLHERYNKLIHRNIVTIDPDEEDKFFKQAEFQKTRKQDDIEVVTTAIPEEEETIEGELVYKKQKAGQEKPKKKKKERSLKKLVKQANQELIKEVGSQK